VSYPISSHLSIRSILIDSYCSGYLVTRKIRGGKNVGKGNKMCERFKYLPANLLKYQDNRSTNSFYLFFVFVFVFVFVLFVFVLFLVCKNEFESVFLGRKKFM